MTTDGYVTLDIPKTVVLDLGDVFKEPPTGMTWSEQKEIMAQLIDALLEWQYDPHMVWNNAPSLDIHRLRNYRLMLDQALIDAYAGHARAMYTRLLSEMRRCGMEEVFMIERRFRYMCAKMSPQGIVVLRRLDD